MGAYKIHLAGGTGGPMYWDTGESFRGWPVKGKPGNSNDNKG